ncbi:MAG: NAD(P)-dependent alcohol dehydrogenase [Actinobacteria bacterium]|nr:NAD(P)-dependent alcohol dehydrogenase [Thermoleophilia bacterium]MCB9012388.1 NAD(P)-dependent alcohol dehydrogenase [Actinomycetota bacterium]
MRAVIYDRYGGPEVLRPAEVPVPDPGPGEVLVEVVATSVNLSDWEALVGRPLYARIGGLRRPRHPVLGSDIAGWVTTIGDHVDGFAIGDEVYGDNLMPKGGFAEYAAVPSSALAPKPPGLTFLQAAALPQSAAIADQGVGDAAAGSRVLINGAGGGSGALAIQVAKRAGARVTGVDSGAKLELMRSLGAEEVLDYRVGDVADGARRFDLVLDLVAHRSVLAVRRLLAPGGVYRCVGGSMGAIVGAAVLGPVVGRLTGRRIGMLGVREGPDHFRNVAELCASGDIEVRIDRTYGLDEVPQALARVGEGQSLGKVVVAVAA